MLGLKSAAAMPRELLLLEFPVLEWSLLRSMDPSAGPSTNYEPAARLTLTTVSVMTQHP